MARGFVTQMKFSTAVQQHRADNKRIPERHRARSARVFGSALRVSDCGGLAGRPRQCYRYDSTLMQE
jgi:hypothetical protein